MTATEPPACDEPGFTWLCLHRHAYDPAGGPPELICSEESWVPAGVGRAGTASDVRELLNCRVTLAVLQPQLQQIASASRVNWGCKLLSGRKHQASRDADLRRRSAAASGLAG